MSITKAEGEGSIFQEEGLALTRVILPSLKGKEEKTGRQVGLLVRS